MIKKKEISESKVESTVCKYAQAKDWLVFKFSSPNNRGVPDRIFMRKGVMFFIEFKKLGKETTKLQKFVGSLIRKAGFAVYEIDNIEDGIKLINSYK